MNILVINGSPKGEYSITLQTVLFLQKKHPGISFEILHAGQRIRSLEKKLHPRSGSNPEGRPPSVFLSGLYVYRPQSASPVY